MQGIANDIKSFKNDLVSLKIRVSSVRSRLSPPAFQPLGQRKDNSITCQGIKICVFDQFPAIRNDSALDLRTLKINCLTTFASLIFRGSFFAAD